MWRILPRSKPSLRERTAERAIADFHARLAPPAPPSGAPDLLGEDIARLNVPHALAIGTLDDGRVLALPRDTVCKHAAIGGSSGNGKSRQTAQLIFQIIDADADGSGPLTEVECCDCKGETTDFIKAGLGARLLKAPPRVRAWIKENVWVAGWQRDRVTPMPLFDNRDGHISHAYLAHLRTQTTVDASSYSFTDGTRHEFAMYAQLSATLGFPPNVAVLTALYPDPAFRSRLLRDVPDPQLRTYYDTVEVTVPKGTIQALRRRVEYLLSFDVIRASIGPPPVSLERLDIRRDGIVRLVDVSTRFALPPSMAAERASHRIIDVLRSAPRRDRRRPAVLVVEEAAKLLATCPELAEPLATGVQTLRYHNVGVWFVAQDFSLLPSHILEPVLLNSFWLAMFQTRRDAQCLATQVVAGADDANAESQARKAFERDIENLPRQTCYVWPRGHRVFRLRAMDCPDPAADGRTIDELVALFDSEVSAKSMISVATADRLIAEWEAEVLGRREIPPPEAPSGCRNTFSMADLLRDLSDEEGSDA